MRYAAVILISLASGVLACTPARAQDYKFSTTVNAPGIKIAGITIGASKKVTSEDKRWGPQDVAYLEKELRAMVTRRLLAKNLMSSQGKGARLMLTIVDVEPNRPTLQAMTKKQQLNFISFGLGGAEVSAHLIGADGKDLGEIHYRWFDDRMDSFTSNNTIWFDARHAFQWFAKRLVRELQNPRPRQAS